MATGATEQNILFNERFVGIRAARIMAVFALIAATTYAALVASAVLEWGQTLTVVLGFIVATTIVMIIGMTIVLLLLNRLTRSYQASRRTSGNAV